MRSVLFLVLVGMLVAPAASAQTTRKRPPKAAKDEDKKTFVIERVAAVVNDTVILESEVVRRARPSLAGMQETEPNARARAIRSIIRQTLEEMIAEELMVQAAIEAKLEVKPEEIDRSLAEVKRKNDLTDAEFERALEDQGYTLDQYRGELERQILRFRAVNVLVRPRVNVTEEQVRRQYEKMVGQSSAVSAVHIQHILIKLPDEPTADDIEQARRKAGELVSKARSGQEFEALVQTDSEDTGTKETGGDLGWFERGELPTEWESVLFSMTPGEVRGPVRGPRGVHVFKVKEVRRDSTRPFEEAKEEIENELYQEALEKQAQLWVEELRKKAHVDVKI